jgi:hypothetical protein
MEQATQFLLDNLALVLSMITATALVVNSVNNRIFAKKAARIAAFGKLHDQDALIMKEILQYNVAPPLANREIMSRYLKEYNRDKDFAKYSIVLFHQINQLYIVFVNRDVLGKEAVDAYRTWFRNVVSPWIEFFPDLAIVMKGVLDGSDGYPAKLIKWLRQDMAKAASKGVRSQDVL